MPQFSRLAAALCCVAASACGQPAVSVSPPSSAASVAAATIVDTDPDDDGIPDAEDECPSDAETRNGFGDEDGCPDEIPREPVCGLRWVPLVEFPTNGDTFDQRAIQVLERVARALKDYPETDLRLIGHTDNRGSEASNQEISLRRAEMVRDYLIEQGIEPERLSVEGKGENAPVASNDTEADRARNRRVEFSFIDRRD